jgi:hypothetical protein
MAVRYEVDSINRLVKTRFSGTVTRWDHGEHLMRLRSDPTFDPTFSELICFDERADIRLGFMDFRSEGDPFRRTSRRAIVASAKKPAVYGIARMFQLSKGEDHHVRLFATINEATTWLEGTPEESNPEILD